MEKKQKKILGIAERLSLTVIAMLIIMRLFFWDFLRHNIVVSGLILGIITLSAAGFWIWRNFKLVGKKGLKKPKEIQAKLEGILHTMFQPLGYDIMKIPEVDEQESCWASLRDSQGIMVVVQYFEISMGELIVPDQLQYLIQQMNVESAPKGICLTTGYFDTEALEFARQHNILTKDGDQLLEMIGKAEEEGFVPEKDYFCRNCGSKLEQNKEVHGLMECVNPDCKKTYSNEELKEQEKIVLGDINTFNISCYNCNRPVEIDTTMTGLMECPYDDCSWVINVDNELLALSGGHDKKVLERLAEIKCPKCDKMIKVPADAEGLWECPCEEKWIIDVGAALGERAQAQVAERLENEEVPEKTEEQAPEDGRKEIEFESATNWEKKTYSLSGSGDNKTTVEEAEEVASKGKTEELSLSTKREVDHVAQQDSKNNLIETSTVNLELDRQAGEDPAAEIEDEVMLDCPGCGAGVPAHLDSCPVCHTPLKQASEKESQQGVVAPENTPPTMLAAGPSNGQAIHHRHAYMSMSTGGLIVFFLISVTAFLAFVYLVTH
jgi:Restriction endonuclease